MISSKLLSTLRIICFITVVILLLYTIIELFINGLYDNDTLIVESISLLIALISLVIAYSSIMISLENKRPVISLNLDFNSRYNQVQLDIQNIGERGAKNITLCYSNNSVWNNGVNKDLSIIASSISVLPQGHSVKKILGIQSEVDINAMTVVSLTYTDLSGIIRFTDDVTIDLNDYKHSLSYENDLTRTLYELQQIPKELKALGDLYSK